MADTATPATNVMTSPLPAATVARTAPVGPWQTLKRLLTPIASLRLTVILFSLSILLVFFGTLAQIDSGIWTVVNQYFWSLYVWIPLQLLVQFGQIFFGVPASATLSLALPLPGGKTLGVLLLLNLLAAHAVRFKLSWRRVGILLAHFGLILMLVGEAITREFAIEGNMRIDEGSSANFVEQNRYSELAIVDPSNPEFDDVVAVPVSMLKTGGSIDSEALPFRIDVVKYMVNSDVVEQSKAPTDVANPATTGAGKSSWVAIEKPEVSGTATKQEVDGASAYITLLRKSDGAALGTYLVSIFLKPQPVPVGDKTFDISLRFKRTYKPYVIHLQEFHFDRFVGTETPRNFSSRVRLVDSEYGTDREVVIRMNEPLRYRGETFYQADWDHATEKGTVLQVVRNPGWLLPYFSCVLVACGLLLHFGQNLVSFLRRRAMT